MLSRTVPFKIQGCWGTYATDRSVVKTPFKHCPFIPVQIILLVDVQETGCKVYAYGKHIFLIHLQGVNLLPLFPVPFPTSRFVYVRNWVQSLWPYAKQIFLIHLQGVNLLPLFPVPFPTSRFVYVRNWVQSLWPYAKQIFLIHLQAINLLPYLCGFHPSIFQLKRCKIIPPSHPEEPREMNSSHFQQFQLLPQIHLASLGS